MPLLKKLNLNGIATVLLWKTEEDERGFFKKVQLPPADRERLESLKHPLKRTEFLALRCCLKAYFGENPEVQYRSSGKPYLDGREKISFSHTRGYAAMIVSPVHEVGIDLEVFREGIKRIAPKYMREDEKKALRPHSETEQLIHYWGAKEVMVKITGNRRLHFKEELRVSPFCYRDFQDTTGLIVNKGHFQKVKLFFKTIDDLHISFGWEI